jgi:hypothetical protein
VPRGSLQCGTWCKQLSCDGRHLPSAVQPTLYLSTGRVFTWSQHRVETQLHLSAVQPTYLSTGRRVFTWSQHRIETQLHLSAVQPTYLSTGRRVFTWSQHRVVTEVQLHLTSTVHGRGMWGCRCIKIRISCLQGAENHWRS